MLFELVMTGNNYNSSEMSKTETKYFECADREIAKDYARKQFERLSHNVYSDGTVTLSRFFPKYVIVNCLESSEARSVLLELEF